MRVDADMRARFEKVRVSLSTQWHEATQSDVMRFTMLLGLDTFDDIDDTKKEFKKAAREREAVAKKAEDSQGDGS